MQGSENSLEALTTPQARGLISRDGVFYAEVPVRGQTAPLLVALHGVTSELQAGEALAALTNWPLPQPSHSVVE